MSTKYPTNVWRVIFGLHASVVAVRRPKRNGRRVAPAASRNPFRTQAERKMISVRTKSALAAAKARGTKLGGLRHRKSDGAVVTLDADARAAGRAARSAQAIARASDVLPIVADVQAAGATSLREIAAALNERGIPAARGGKWSAVQVQRVLSRSAA
ncbi:MAG: recombinase family protein [Roseiarcus sp.]